MDTALAHRARDGRLRTCRGHVWLPGPKQAASSWSCRCKTQIAQDTAKAPRALNPTTAPYRPNTFTSMIGCEVKAIYDANGLKFDALNIVDLATGFLIPDVLDDPRCRRAPALSWAQTEPLPAKNLLGIEDERGAANLSGYDV